MESVAATKGAGGSQTGQAGEEGGSSLLAITVTTTPGASQGEGPTRHAAGSEWLAQQQARVLSTLHIDAEQSGSGAASDPSKPVAHGTSVT